MVRLQMFGVNGRALAGSSLLSPLLLLSFILVSKLGANLVAATGVDDENLPEKIDLIVDEDSELSDEAIGSLMKGFGKHISDIMSDGMDKIIEDVKHDEGDGVERKRLKDAKEMLTEDTQARIEMAGRQNRGETTQFGLKKMAGGIGETFVSQVSRRLQVAGSYLSSQINSLSGLAPNVRGKLKAAKGKLRSMMRWPTFLNYKIKFNKAYKSLREELYRQMVYIHTQAVVGLANLNFLVGRATHRLKATQFADCTTKEYHEVYNNKELETRENNEASEMDALDRSKLERLAAENKNVFGESMLNVEVKSRNNNNKLVKGLSRKKRSNELDEEENDDDEDDMFSDASDGPLDDGDVKNELNSRGNKDESDKFHDSSDEFSDSENDDDDNDDDDDDERSDYEADELSEENLNDLEDIIDEALNEGDTFKPIDLRTTNCVIEPQNQNDCGACYAFVTSAAASYFNCMMSPEKKIDRYNSRFVSDCGRYMTVKKDERPTLRGCSGGRLSQAILFARIAGTRGFFPYEIARWSYNIQSDQCAYPRPQKLSELNKTPVPFYKKAQFIVLNLEDIDLHLRTVGPVFVNVRLWKEFKDQGDNIYGGFEDSKIKTIHSMLIVGHDKDKNGRDYYIVWNSHGIAWGERGYLRIYADSLNYFKVFFGGFMLDENLEEIDVEHEPEEEESQQAAESMDIDENPQNYAKKFGATVVLGDPLNGPVTMITQKMDPSDKMEVDQ